MSLPIVTNGLLLYLDVANRNSYISGSTIWNDMSGNNFNGTISGSILPMYDYSNGGNLLFKSASASDQRVDYGSSPNFSLLQYTLSAWVNPNGFGAPNKTHIISRDNGNNSGYALKLDNFNVTNGITIDNTNSTGVFLSAANQIILGQWNYICATFIDGGAGSGSAILYKNNTVANMGSITSPTIISTNVVVGNSHNLDRCLDGKIAIASIYNRALSQAEVVQNYNAQKSRFGLL